MERLTERYSDGKSIYLRVSGSAETMAENLYEIKMINANKPAGLLPVHISRSEDGVFCDYEITGLRSLKDSEGDAVQVDYLYSLITAMAKEAEVLAEFMLDPNKLLLTPETIFFRPWAGEVHFCYDPGKNEPLQSTLRSLMEYFLKKLDPKDEEDILFMYGLYQRTREPMVTLTSFHEFFLENRERYLKIGEEREQRLLEQKKKESEAALSVEQITENSLYEELGLEKTPRTASFSFLKRGHEKGTTPVQDEVLLDLDRFRDRANLRDAAEPGEGEETKESSVTEPLPEPMPEPVTEAKPGKARSKVRTFPDAEEPQVPEPASDRKDLDPRAVLGKLKPYGFELAVGGIVLAGVILYFTI